MKRLKTISMLLCLILVMPYIHGMSSKIEKWKKISACAGFAVGAAGTFYGIQELKHQRKIDFFDLYVWPSVVGGCSAMVAETLFLKSPLHKKLKAQHAYALLRQQISFIQSRNLQAKTNVLISRNVFDDGLVPQKTSKAYLATFAAEDKREFLMFDKNLQTIIVIAQYLSISKDILPEQKIELKEAIKPLYVLRENITYLCNAHVNKPKQ